MLEVPVAALNASGLLRLISDSSAFTLSLQHIGPSRGCTISTSTSFIGSSTEFPAAARGSILCMERPPSAVEGGKQRCSRLLRVAAGCPHGAARLRGGTGPG